MSNYGKHYGADDIEELKAKSNLWLYIIIIAAGMLAAALIWWILNPQPQQHQQIQQQQQQQQQAPPWPTYTPYPTPPAPFSSLTVHGSITGAKEAVFASYKGVVVTTYDDTSWGGLVGQTLVYTLYGEVKAGIDLNQVTESDIVIDGRTVIVTIPEPRIWPEISIDLERSQVEYAKTGIITRLWQSDHQIQDETMRKARDHLIAEAIEAGIMTEAYKNQSWFYDQLKILRDPITGEPYFTNIIVKYR